MKKPVGSFGLPDNIKRAMQDREIRKTEADREAERPKGPPEELGEDLPPEGDDKQDANNEKTDVNTEKQARMILSEIGVDFTPADFHNFLFHGHVTKRVVVSKTNEVEFTAEIKTLTGHELNMADELLAEDIDKIPMTKDGMMARRSVWYLSFGLKKLVDREIVKPIYLNEDKKNGLDVKEMAIEKRKIIVDLAPSVTDKLIRCQAALTTALNLMVSSKDTLFLDAPPTPAPFTGEQNS